MKKQKLSAENEVHQLIGHLRSTHTLNEKVSEVRIQNVMEMIVKNAHEVTGHPSITALLIETFIGVVNKTYCSRLYQAALICVDNNLTPEQISEGATRRLRSLTDQQHYAAVISHALEVKSRDRITETDIQKAVEQLGVQKKRSETDEKDAPEKRQEKDQPLSTEIFKQRMKKHLSQLTPDEQVFVARFVTSKKVLRDCIFSLPKIFPDRQQLEEKVKHWADK